VATDRRTLGSGNARQLPALTRLQERRADEVKAKSNPAGLATRRLPGMEETSSKASGRPTSSDLVDAQDAVSVDIIAHTPPALDFGPFISIKDDRVGAPLLIVFSSVNANNYSFFNAFDDVAATKIFLRDQKDSWYHQGVGGELSSIDAVVERLQAEIKRLSPKRIVTFGTSMGGYAAILFGMRLGASSMVTVSPQTLLDPRLPHTPTLRFEGRDFDLVPLIETWSGDARIYVFFGAADMVDCYNALRLAAKRLTLVPIREADHLVAAKLAKAGTLKRAVVSAIEEKPFSANEDLDKRVLDPVVAQMIIRTTESHYLDASFNAGRYARALSILTPGWSAPSFILSLISEAKGSLAEAQRYAEAASRAAPGSVTYADHHANVLHRMGEDPRAVAAYEATLKLRPRHYSALCNLAILLSKQGNSERAISLLDAAIESRPRLLRAGLIKNQILDSLAPAKELPNVFDKNQL